MFRPILNLKIVRYCTLLAVTLATVSASPVYNLKIVAQRGDVIDGTEIGQPGRALLNNSGQYVVGDSNHLWTQEGLIVSAGDVIDGKTLEYPIVHAALNDSGKVVFAASDAAGYGLYTPDAFIVGAG